MRSYRSRTPWYLTAAAIVIAVIAVLGIALVLDGAISALLALLITWIWSWTIQPSIGWPTPSFLLVFGLLLIVTLLSTVLGFGSSHRRS